MASILQYPYDATLKSGIWALERNLLPDLLIRRACRALINMRLKSSTKDTVEEQLQDLLDFVRSLKAMPIAINTQDANEQHYEVPTEFYQLFLGKHLKYSSCYFKTPTTTLDDAEEAMLALYCERAQLQDGQEVLELGCGWGSLSLYVAAKYPSSRITGISNSASQRAFIEEEARARGITNLTIITENIIEYESDKTYNRVVSIEMFEHMKNYQKLLGKVAAWMKPDALLFIHIFAHKEFAYHFEDKGDDDWITRYFFSGGTMAADALLLYFQDDVSIADHWRVNGTHYALTSEAWLKKFDQNLPQLRPIIAKIYGQEQALKWTVYWRTFFLSLSELFGHSGGQEWIVSHYLFKKRN